RHLASASSRPAGAGGTAMPTVFQPASDAESSQRGGVVLAGSAAGVADSAGGASLIRVSDDCGWQAATSPAAAAMASSRVRDALMSGSSGRAEAHHRSLT